MRNPLSNYTSVCRLIELLFPGQIEVVLHDLKSEKIVAIAGTISNRVSGDSSLLDVTNLEKEADSNDIIGPYLQTNWDGEILKSFTAILRDDGKEPIGLICVNCRTASFAAAAELLTMLSQTENTASPDALFSNDWRTTVNQQIAKVNQERNITLVNAKRADKVEMIKTLDNSGLLEFRGSSDYIAQSLGVSRASFYNLLKDARSATADSINKQPIKVA